jgi:hypothetical protein
MMTIDCAFDEQIANKLTIYLNQKYNAKQDQSLVLVDDKISKKVLEEFIRDFNKDGYSITNVNPDTFVIAKNMSMEGMGLIKCSFCGYVGTKEDTKIHQKNHSHALGLSTFVEDDNAVGETGNKK